MTNTERVNTSTEHFTIPSPDPESQMIRSPWHPQIISPTIKSRATFRIEKARDPICCGSIQEGNIGINIEAHWFHNSI